MSPWIEAVRATATTLPIDSAVAATRHTAATRWMDDSDISLRGAPLRSLATVSGDLLKVQEPALEVVAGRASVSASLSVDQRVVGMIVAGSSSVSGIIGTLYGEEGSSGGSTTVGGELFHGQVEHLFGVSTGKATVGLAAWAELYVDRLQWIDGEQAGEDHGDGERRPASGSSRDSGPTRVRFSPRSIGRTNSKTIREKAK